MIRWIKRADKIELFLVGLLAACILFVLVSFTALAIYEIKAQHHINEYTLTVTDKEVKNDGDSSKYLIFTSDAKGKVKTLENVDSLFKGKHNSSDIYAELKKGKTYKFTVYGYRLPFWSTYENIINYKEVK